MTDLSSQKRQACVSACETKYLRCIKRTRAGCVEVLRVCKESCPGR